MVAPTQSGVSVAPAQTPVVMYFDGLVEPHNPGGHGCGGWWAPDARTERGALQGCRYYGQGEGMTNNVAEYEAALDALRALYRAGYRGAVELRGDSGLVVEQFGGRWACNAPRLQELLGRLRHAASHFAQVVLVWVPRDANMQADALSRRAYMMATRASR